MKLGDSHYGEWRDRLELETTDKQDIAAVFLEGKGYEFLVDFGYENAIDKAKLIMTGQKIDPPYRNRTTLR